MTREQYFDMCEMLGSEPVEEEIPVELTDLSLEAQQAMELASFLPDRIDGFSGMYLGKDMGGLGDLFEVLSISDRYHVLLFLRVIVQDAINRSAEKLKKNNKQKPNE